MSCPDCFTGTIHLGNPTGTTTTLHGLPVYVAKPPEGVTPKGIVTMIPDVFGWEFVNNRLLCDNYAQKGGFLVYLPDFMAGNSMPCAFIDLMKEKIKKPASWFTTIFYKPLYILRVIGMIIPFLFNNRESKAKPRIFNFFRALRISPPPFPTNNLKLGAAGFCWGGRYTILLCGGRGLSAIDAPEPLIDCGFTAHPSMVSVPKDIEAVKLPLSVAMGNEDWAMKGPLIQQMKEILEKKKDDHECVIMPGAKHGFAVRIDPKDAFQNKYAEQAEGQAVDWFSRWFG